MNNKKASAEEINALTKVINYVLGETTETVSEIETEFAKECLKKFADNCPNWNDEQKRQFKESVDLLQNPSKN